MATTNGSNGEDNNDCFSGSIELDEFFKHDNNILGNIVKLLPQAVSQSLYLCTTNGDYERPTIAQKMISPGESRAPSKSQEIEVGLTVGRKLKDAMGEDTKLKSHEHPNWYHYWSEEEHELI